MKRFACFLIALSAFAADPEDVVPSATSASSSKVIQVQPEQYATLTLRWKRVAPNSWELVTADATTVKRTIILRNGAEVGLSEEDEKKVSLLEDIKEQSVTNAATNVVWLPGFIWTANSGATRVDLGKAPTGVVRAVRAH